MIYDLRYTIALGLGEFPRSAGILPAYTTAHNPETRRQDAGASGYKLLFILRSAFCILHSL